MPATFIVRRRPEGEAVARVEFPEDTEGFGIAHYVITKKAPLRRGGAPRFLVNLVLTADGLMLNDNIPVACTSTLHDAVARAKA